MKCPTCTLDLQMTDRQGIEIDYCPQCRGVWLDRGELDKIIERSQEAPSQPQAAPPLPPQHHESHQVQESYRDEYRHQDRPRDDRTYGGHDGRDRRKHKKESFLGDLFDFGD